jgi:hypothetical protein
MDHGVVRGLATMTSFARCSYSNLTTISGKNATPRHYSPVALRGCRFQGIVVEPQPIVTSHGTLAEVRACECGCIRRLNHFRSSGPAVAINAETPTLVSVWWGGMLDLIGSMQL